MHVMIVVICKKKNSWLRDKVKNLEKDSCKFSSTQLENMLSEFPCNMTSDGYNCLSSRACVSLNKVIFVKPVVDSQG